jgi:hypothetical protein
LVIDMTTSASVLGSEFNDFLFAPIGEDRNDMPLSVLSALARLDIDPWQEAGKLAQLPGEVATQRLASLIAALPPAAWLPGHSEPGTIAARLIMLLPRRSNSNIPLRRSAIDASDVTKFRAGLWMYAAFIVFMLTAQWVAASRQPSVEAGGTQAPASDTVSPQAPLSNSGD